MLSDSKSKSVASCISNKVSKIIWREKQFVAISKPELEAPHPTFNLMQIDIRWTGTLSSNHAVYEQGTMQTFFNCLKCD